MHGIKVICSGSINRVTRSSSFCSATSAVLIALLIGTAVSGCERLEFMREASRLGSLSDSNQQDTTTADIIADTDANGRQAALLSAFFGLDDALPRFANRIFCDGASGKDGMPVIFSHEIALEALQAGDFRVVAESGQVGDVTCVTPAPADDVGETRTILMIGQFGDIEDQPASVEVVGNILSKGGGLNFRGARTPVTGLEEGPTMVWAEAVPESEWALGSSGTSFGGGGGTGCPVGTQHVIRVTWAGGVMKPGGDEIDDVEFSSYRLTMTFDDGSEGEVTPMAVGDLGDGDNNHELCLDRVGTVLRVSFPAGLVTDPREDLNPATAVTVSTG